MPSPLPIENGRRFGCTRCGNCCARDGYVYMSEREVERIAEHLELSKSEFKTRYKVQKDGLAFFLEAKEQKGCPLLTADRKCSVHEVKPAQCASWPFWPETLDDKREWEAAKSYCFGLDAPDGKLYSHNEIIQIRDFRRGTDELEKRLARHRTNV